MDYQKFSELRHAMGDDLDGDITGDSANKLSQFYHYWSQYLHPQGAFWAFIYIIPGGIAKALYLITSSLENVFNNLFKLFGLFGYLGDESTVVGKVYHYGQLFGVTLFTLALVYKGLTSAFGKRPKYGDIATAFLLVTLGTAVLPLAVTTISGIVAQDAKTAQTMSSKDKKFDSLALQPLKTNVVDLKALINNDWDTSKFEMDDQGNLKPNQKSKVEVNYITDDTKKRESSNFVTNIDFTANYGATDTQVLDDMQKENNGAYNGVKGLMLHKLDANGSGISTIESHKFAKGLNAFESTYMRYQVNWIGMYLQYALLIFLLFSMSIKLVKSVIDILIQGMISPLQGYMTAVTGKKKYKELLMTIFSAFMGILFEVIIMRVVLEVLRDFPSLTLSAVKGFDTSFFSGLNMWEQIIASAIVYLGTFFAAMQGISAIERWLGVSTGHGDNLQQMVGAAMMGSAAGHAIGATGQASMGLASAGASAAGAAGKGLKTGFSAANRGVNFASGVMQHAKEHGVANTVKGGLSNANRKIDKTVQAGKDKVGGLKDKVDQEGLKSFNNGYNSVSTDPIDRAMHTNNSESVGSHEATANGGITDPANKQQNSEVKKGGLRHDPTVVTGSNSNRPSQASQAKDSMQQAAQSLSGSQDHIRGYNLDEDD